MVFSDFDWLAPALAIGKLFIVILTESLLLPLSLSSADTVIVWLPGESSPRLQLGVLAIGDVKVQSGNNSPSSKNVTRVNAPSLSLTEALAVTILLGDSI